MPDDTAGTPEATGNAGSTGSPGRDSSAGSPGRDSSAGSPGPDSSAGDTPARHVVTGDDLRRMTPEQRATLVRELVSLEGPDPLSDRWYRSHRTFTLVGLVGCCVVLAAWIPVLSLTLPRHYAAGQWGVAWTGFDIALFVSLASTAWAVWRRRQVVILAALVTGVLLACDAWFDVTLSWGNRDLPLSLAFAVLVELPLSVALLAMARRMVVLTVHAVRVREGESGADPPLRRVPLFALSPTRRTRRAHRPGR